MRRREQQELNRQPWECTSTRVARERFTSARGPAAAGVEIFHRASVAFSICFFPHINKKKSHGSAAYPHLASILPSPKDKKAYAHLLSFRSIFTQTCLLRPHETLRKIRQTS